MKNSQQIIYFDKYIKYKKKYLHLTNQYGGVFTINNSGADINYKKNQSDHVFTLNNIKEVISVIIPNGTNLYKSYSIKHNNPEDCELNLTELKKYKSKKFTAVLDPTDKTTINIYGTRFEILEKGLSISPTKLVFSTPDIARENYVKFSHLIEGRYLEYPYSKTGILSNKLMVGLPNIANTCFINSLILLIVSIVGFANDLVKINFHQNLVNLIKICQGQTLDSDASFYLNEYITGLLGICYNPITGGDPQELLNIILDSYNLTDLFEQYVGITTHQDKYCLNQIEKIKKEESNQNVESSFNLSLSAIPFIPNVSITMKELLLKYLTDIQPAHNELCGNLEIHSIKRIDKIREYCVLNITRYNYEYDMFGKAKLSVIPDIRKIYNVLSVILGKIQLFLLGVIVFIPATFGTVNHYIYIYIDIAENGNVNFIVFNDNMPAQSISSNDWQTTQVAAMGEKSTIYDLLCDGVMYLYKQYDPVVIGQISTLRHEPPQTAPPAAQPTAPPKPPPPKPESEPESEPKSEPEPESEPESEPKSEPEPEPAIKKDVDDCPSKNYHIKDIIDGKILGVDVCNKKEPNKSSNRIRLLIHPDKNKGCEDDATVKFKDFNLYCAINPSKSNSTDSTDPVYDNIYFIPNLNFQKKDFSEQDYPGFLYYKTYDFNNVFNLKDTDYSKILTEVATDYVLDQLYMQNIAPPPQTIVMALQSYIEELTKNNIYKKNEDTEKIEGIYDKFIEELIRIKLYYKSTKIKASSGAFKTNSNILYIPNPENIRRYFTDDEIKTYLNIKDDDISILQQIATIGKPYFSHHSNPSKDDIIGKLNKYKQFFIRKNQYMKIYDHAIERLDFIINVYEADVYNKYLKYRQKYMELKAKINN